MSEVKDAFKRFLTPGKPGYVPHRWPTLDEGVQWIRAAGGDAVLAHPARYELGPAAMRRLIQAFTAAGGVAIEVLSSAHTATEAAEIATLARVHGLRASVGSDYHGPGESPLDFGELPELPAGLTPVWQGWEDRPR